MGGRWHACGQDRPVIVLWALLWVLAGIGAVSVGVTVWVLVAAYLPPREPFVSFGRHAAGAAADFEEWDREVDPPRRARRGGL